jgi:hypothetical protein
LPPGLYEAVMTPKTGESANADLIVGDWIVRFRAAHPGGHPRHRPPNLENEQRFATVKRVSEINLSLYRTLLQPLVQATMNEQTTGLMKQINPSDLPFALFSDRNPLMKQVAQLAEQVRQQRQPVAPTTRYCNGRQRSRKGLIGPRRLSRSARQELEQIFLATYSSPLLASSGWPEASDEPPRKRPGFRSRNASPSSSSASVNSRHALPKAACARRQSAAWFISAWLVKALTNVPSINCATSVQKIAA